MTNVIKKIAEFFSGKEYYEKGEEATLELSPEELREICNINIERIRYKEILAHQKARQLGMWINDENHIPICNRCGYIPQYDRAIDDYEYSNFCPNCGAKMESENKE